MPAKPQRGGPWVGAAFICEKVLNEQDGVQSYIRVVDRRTFFGTAEQMPRIKTVLTINVLLKAGEARGRHQLRMKLISPSGTQLTDMQAPVFFESDDRGVSLTVDVAFEAEEEGLYWFEVLFGENQELLTKVPYRIIYQPRPLHSSGQGPVR